MKPCRVRPILFDDLHQEVMLGLVKGSTTPKAIAHSCSIGITAVARVLRNLESAGIVRWENHTDSRAFVRGAANYHLTRDGEAIAHDIGEVSN